MSERLPLRKQLAAAWRETLEGPYRNHLINSERGLQVHFCHALTKQFQDAGVNRRLFVEPTVNFAIDDVRCPDLVICNSQRIIGVVEFKYAPRAFAEYAKDVETLHRFLRHADAIVLSNERFRGEGAPKSYSLAPDSVLCWAAVYADTFIEIEHPKFSSLDGHFLRLDAITHASSSATILSSID
jgi:hypothetical protein